MHGIIYKKVAVFAVIIFLFGFGISFTSWGRTQMVQYQDLRLNHIQQKITDLESILVNQKESLSSSLRETYMQSASVSQSARLLNQVQDTEESLEKLTKQKTKILFYLSENTDNY